jgi:hypothetical protein
VFALFAASGIGLTFTVARYAMSDAIDTAQPFDIDVDHVGAYESRPHAASAPSSNEICDIGNEAAPLPAMALLLWLSVRRPDVTPQDRSCSRGRNGLDRRHW